MTSRSATMTQQPNGLTFPIRLRCASPAELVSDPRLEAALSRALGRAFARARTALPAPLWLGAGVALQAPRLVGGGISGTDAAVLLARVRRAVEAAAQAQAMPTASAPAKPSAPVVRLDRRRRGGLAERFDPQRYDAATGTYELPSYNGGKVKTSTSRTPASDDNAARIRASVAKLEHDDGTLFQQILGQTRLKAVIGPVDSLHVETLRAFARQNPAKFRQLLLAAVIGGAAAIARVYDFSGGAFHIVDRDKHAIKEAARRLDIAADALHLASGLPEAAWLPGELERRIPGFRRILALLDPLANVSRDLIDYLRNAEKADDPAVRDLLKALNSFDLWRYPALVAALVAGMRIKGSAGPQQELAESRRVLEAILAKVREIDGWLVLYRMRSGAAADDLEEVQVLLEARRRYLGLPADVLPGASYRPQPHAALLAEADKFYADWRGLAADKKLAGVRDAAKELLARLPPLKRDPFFTAQGREFFGVPKFNVSNKPDEVAAGVKALVSLIGGKRVRNEAYLTFATEAQRKIAELAVKWQLLTYWLSAAGIVHFALEHEDVISGDKRVAWGLRTDAIIDEIKAQYAHPDYATLPARTKEWEQRLDALVKEVNEVLEDAAKRERRRKLLINLAITVVVIVVTRGIMASAIIRGLQLGVVGSTLLAAATVTALSTTGRALALHEEVELGGVLKEFGQNAAFGFLFGWLNVRYLRGARYLAPGRDLAQVAIVLGADAAVGAALNLALSKLTTGALPEDMELFLLSSAVLSGTGALLGASDVREQLGRLKARDQLLAHYDRVKAECAGAFGDMQKIGAGGPNPAQHAALQQRLLGVLPDLEAVLKQLSGLSESELKPLGLSRAKIAAVLRILPHYAEVVRTSQWTPSSRGRVRATPTVRSPGGRKPPPIPKGARRRTSDFDDYPEGLVHMELTRDEAYRSYEQSIGADPSRETTIYRDLESDEHIVVQGEAKKTSGDWSREPHLQRRWQLVEHWHADGVPFASGDDFYTLMFPQLEGWTPRQAVSTRIRWQHPVSKKTLYTEIGYTPGNKRPYWIRIQDEHGNWLPTQEFEHEPWTRGSDYEQFLTKNGFQLSPHPERLPGVRMPSAGGKLPPKPPAHDDTQLILDKLGLPPGSVEDLVQGRDVWGDLHRGQAKLVVNFEYKDGRLTAGVLGARNPKQGNKWEFVKAFLAFKQQSINLARTLGAKSIRFEGQVVTNEGIEALLRDQKFQPVPDRFGQFALEKSLTAAEPPTPEPGGSIPDVKSPSGKPPAKPDLGRPTFNNLSGRVPVGGQRIELREVNGRWLEITPGGGGVRPAHGTYSFVTQDGRIWGSRYGHVEASMGQRVSYAGQVWFDTGGLQKWSNESGSYRPAGEFAAQAGLPGTPHLVPPHAGKKSQLAVFQPGKDDVLVPRAVPPRGAAPQPPSGHPGDQDITRPVPIPGKPPLPPPRVYQDGKVFIHSGLTKVDGYRKYDELIDGDRSREVAIYVDPDNDEFIVIRVGDKYSDGWPDLRGFAGRRARDRALPAPERPLRVGRGLPRHDAAAAPEVDPAAAGHVEGPLVEREDEVLRAHVSRLPAWAREALCDALPRPARPMEGQGVQGRALGAQLRLRPIHSLGRARFQIGRIQDLPRKIDVATGQAKGLGAARHGAAVRRQPHRARRALRAAAGGRPRRQPVDQQDHPRRRDRGRAHRRRAPGDTAGSRGDGRRVKDAAADLVDPVGHPHGGRTHDAARHAGQQPALQPVGGREGCLHREHLAPALPAAGPDGAHQRRHQCGGRDRRHRGSPAQRRGGCEPWTTSSPPQRARHCRRGPTTARLRRLAGERRRRLSAGVPAADRRYRLPADAYRLLPRSRLRGRRRLRQQRVRPARPGARALPQSQGGIRKPARRDAARGRAQCRARHAAGVRPAALPLHAHPRGAGKPQGSRGVRLGTGGASGGERCLASPRSSSASAPATG